MNLPSIIQCGASPRRPLLEYLPSLGRGTTIHLRIGHPYISPADVRPSNGFGSLAHNKDATVVVPAVAAVGRPPIVRKLHYVLSHCVCMLFLFGWPPCQRSDVTLMEVSQHALDSLYIRSIWLLYIVMFFVNLIWYLYLFWLNKHCLSLSLSLWPHRACMVIITWDDSLLHNCKGHSGYGHSQCETTIHCNGISHWLCPYPE